MEGDQFEVVATPRLKDEFHRGGRIASSLPLAPAAGLMVTAMEPGDFQNWARQKREEITAAGDAVAEERKAREELEAETEGN